MRLLTLIFKGMVSLVERTGLLPRTASIAVRRNRRQNILAEAEAERLDRIRNPDKYLGKS